MKKCTCCECMNCACLLRKMKGQTTTHDQVALEEGNTTSFYQLKSYVDDPERAAFLADLSKYLKTDASSPTPPWYMSDPIALQRIHNLEKIKKELQWLAVESTRSRQNWNKVSLVDH